MVHANGTSDIKNSVGLTNASGVNADHTAVALLSSAAEVIVSLKGKQDMVLSLRWYVCFPYLIALT